ncbi:MAG: SDR family oxidoreductase [Wenzhouxiangellaceae bacterium]|nr:SDR family oxidoreductase [Wenzhouxiangellaceae bacterium]
MSANSPRLLIAGCGDLGIRLAGRLVDWQVHGLRRRVEVLPSTIVPEPFDLGDADSLAGLALDWDAIVYTATPSARDEAAYRRAYVEGLDRLLERVQCKRLIFVSSTAVYGQDDGAWVDEDSPTEATAFNGRIVREAEQLAQSAGGRVVRFSGIYGPGRTWMLRQAQAGAVACRREPPQWTNRIHADDCAAVLDHLLKLENPDALYVASDREPATRWDVLSWLAERLGVPGPVEEHAAGGQGKRVSSRRLVDSGFEFAYPDFRAGYAELIDQEIRNAHE